MKTPEQIAMETDHLEGRKNRTAINKLYREQKVRELLLLTSGVEKMNTDKPFKTNLHFEPTSMFDKDTTRTITLYEYYGFIPENRRGKDDLSYTYNQIIRYRFDLTPSLQYARRVSIAKTSIYNDLETGKCDYRPDYYNNDSIQDRKKATALYNDLMKHIRHPLKVQWGYRNSYHCIPDKENDIKIEHLGRDKAYCDIRVTYTDKIGSLVSQIVNESI